MRLIELESVLVTLLWIKKLKDDAAKREAKRKLQHQQEIEKARQAVGARCDHYDEFAELKKFMLTNWYITYTH